MEQRPLGRTGADVSVIGLGTWQLGGDWGDVDDDAAGEVLDAALDAGVTLLDTADVYGDGRSEERIRKALAPRGGPAVRRHQGRPARRPVRGRRSTRRRTCAPGSTGPAATSASTTLDLVQLHCPPPAVYSDQRVYDTLDALVEEEADRRLRRLGGDRRRGPDRAAAPRRADDPGHPQHLPAQAAGGTAAGRRRARASASSPGCRWPAGCSPASTTSRPRSPPTTTGTSTATARPSTSVRPSPACRSRSASPRPARSPRSPATACRPRRSRCAG